MLNAILVAAAVLLLNPCGAQISYTMVPSAGVYTPLSGGVDVPDLSAGSDLTISAPLPIGFNFVFDNTTYTDFQISDNGYIHFGNDLAPTGYGNASGDLIIPNDFTDATASMPGTNTTRPFVAPLWEELAMAGLGGGGSVSYLLTGSAPNQTLTIEWNKVSWRAPTATDQISFQVVLHETSNVIDFIYFAGPVALGNLPTASIGLAGITNGDFYSLSDSGPNPTASKTVSTNSINTKPATGQMYSWLPFIPTGINSDQLPASVTSVYFNSNTNYLTVKSNFNETGNFDFEVVDLMGRVVFTSKMQVNSKGAAEFNYQLPACAAGIYMVKVSGGNTTSQLKFVKE